MTLLIVAFVLLQSPRVQTYLTGQIAKQLSAKYKTNISLKGVSIAFFNKIVLKDILVEDQMHDSLLFVNEFVARIDTLSFKRLHFGFNELKLDGSLLKLKTDSAGNSNFQFLLDQLKSEDTIQADGSPFEIAIDQFNFSDAEFSLSYPDSAGLHQIVLDDINLQVEKFQYLNENISMDISHFTMNNLKGLNLVDFSAKFYSSPDSLNLIDLKLQTSNSLIPGVDIRIDKSKIGKVFDFAKLKFNIDLQNSTISLKDIAQFVPSLTGMDENIEVSGQVSGKISDLKGKNIELVYATNTRLAFDFYLNGLPDIENTYMQFDLKQSFADFDDIKKVKLPGDRTFKHLHIPEELFQIGKVQYNGNFTGFISDFVAYGTFRSKFGTISTDLSFVPSEGQRLKIDGKLRTINFNLGKLLKSEQLEAVTFNGSLMGLLNRQSKQFSAKVSGRIDSIMFNHYRYKNITLDGDLLNKKFDGNLVIDDPNLKFKFIGGFDLNIPVPVFNFEMLLDQADLNALQITNMYAKSEVSFDLDANFSGSNIDNLVGDIHFKEGYFRNENGDISFKNFDLKTFKEKEPVLQIRSDYLDGEIRGQYQLQHLYSSIKEIVAYYIPSSGLMPIGERSNNNFQFKLNLHDLNRFTQVLFPSLEIAPAKLSGRINSSRHELQMQAELPFIKYQSTKLTNLNLQIDGNTQLAVKCSVDELDLVDQIKIYQVKLDMDAQADLVNSTLAWDQDVKKSRKGSLITRTKFTKGTKTPHIEIGIEPSQIYLSDYLWAINSSSLSIDSTSFQIDGFKLNNQSQSIELNGAIGKGKEKLDVLFQHIGLENLNRFIDPTLLLKGQLNGTLSITDFYSRIRFFADLNIDELGLFGKILGNAHLESKWDKASEAFDLGLTLVSEDRKTLQSSGYYLPKKDSLSIDAEFDNFSLIILQPLLGESFKNVRGTASGKVHVYGPSNHIRHDGGVYVTNAGLMLTELNANYTMNDSVIFSNDKIIFPDVDIVDDYKNTGIFTGSIQHQSFSKMVYDMTVKSNRILAINTTPAINQQFYGKTFGSGLVRITGKGASVLIEGVARTEKGTEMNISMAYSSDAQEYDFLTFVAANPTISETKSSGQVIDSKLEMKFTIEVTPEAKAQLIYNSKIGDMIRAQGSGNLQLQIDRNNNIFLYGQYTVAQGDYLFTLQNVINKKFEIQQGGTIDWNGDPFDANLNLNAIYKLKASLSQLIADTEDNQRIPVECKIALSNSLNNPEIKFDIELPSAEDRIVDEIKQFINTEEDMNKQILSLLILGQFYTPEYMRGSGNYLDSNTSLAQSTAATGTELLSNQLSNWLSQMSEDFDIGFNWRPGNEITNDEIELALSTQLFNDRVSINGNIGNNSAQSNSVNSSNFVGDADINVKLTQNGKLQLKAYNHANNTMIYETSPYTQGVGISYHEDFNDLEQLWQKIKSIFSSKTKKP